MDAIDVCALLVFDHGILMLAFSSLFKLTLRISLRMIDLLSHTTLHPTQNQKKVASTTGGVYGALGLLSGAEATAAAATVKAHHHDTLGMKRINDAAEAASAASHAMNSTLPTAESKAAEEEAAYAALGAEGGGGDNAGATTLGAGSTTLNQSSTAGGSAVSGTGVSSSSAASSSSSSAKPGPPPPVNIRYINYVKLCRDLEPTDGSGRDGDDVRVSFHMRVAFRGRTQQHHPSFVCAPHLLGPTVALSAVCFPPDICYPLMVDSWIHEFLHLTLPP